VRIVLRHQNTIEIIIIIVVFIVVNLLSTAFQQPLSYHEGKGWDGVSYYGVAEQLSQGQLPEEQAPFVYRIGTPFLAALFFKHNLLLGFKVVNIIASIVAVALFVVWLRLYISNWKIRTLLVILFITQWHAPMRYAYFMPVETHSWLFVFLLAGLIVIHKAKTRRTPIVICTLCLITLVGVFFRETAILVPIALLFAANPFKYENCSLSSVRIGKRPPLIFFIPLLLGIIGIATVHLIASQTNDYSYMTEAARWAYNKPLLTYVLAWFIAFGPITIVLVYDWRRALTFLGDHQFQLLDLILIAVLAWIGGGDTEKFVYWSMPVIYLLIGRALENNASLLRSPLFIAVLGLSQCISQRLIWTTPDYPGVSSHSLPILTPVGSNVPFLDLWSIWGSRLVEGVSLLQYLFLGLLLLVWLNYRAGKLRNTSNKVM